jgi:lysophospholipase L1-like esterase
MTIQMSQQLQSNVVHRLHLLRLRKDVRVIALGDSSVFGVGDLGDDLPFVGAGWSGRLARDIGAVAYINVAKNGARAKHLLKSQLPAALAMRPDLALFCIGTNDVLRGDFSPKEIYRALVRIVQELNAIDCVVIFLGLPNPMQTAPGPKFLRRILEERVEIVNGILNDVAKDFDARVIPTDILKNSKEYWHVDRMHPSPLGHQFIADHVRKSLFLPRVKGSRLPVDSDKSLKFELVWLMTNGSKWFLKRSIDLIPGLIWLVISDKFIKRTRWNSASLAMVNSASKSRPDHRVT